MYRTSIRRPRSHGRGLILGNVPPPKNRLPSPHCSMLAETDSPPVQITLFAFFSFSCQCPPEVFADCESKPKQRETKGKRPDLRLETWQALVVELLLKTTALQMARIHPPFWFQRQLPSKQKEMAATGFGNETAHARGAKFIAWASHCWSPWKQWQKRSGYHFHAQKRSGSETSVFERPIFGSVSEKLRIGGRAFSKSYGSVLIRVTVSI